MASTKKPAARVALVTGGNRGIGFEICKALAAKGLDVILGARNRELGDEAAGKLGVKSAWLDVSDRGSVDAAANELGPIDVLVNNAGVYPSGTVLDARAEAWREAFETNFFGALSLCRAFVPGMLERGYGRVVNVSSGYGAFAEGLEGPAPYALSKLVLNGLTMKLASEVKGDVKVNAACPGWVKTRMGGPGADVTAEQGADTIVWLATLPPSGPSGGFFRRRKKIPW
jgi:NAD(P)-dependent dehydrogenase (short-subunit alcohol dehydrogenase family)